MPIKTSDPIRPWFIAAEELGEFVGIRFGRIPEGATDPEWIYFRHTDYDGIGGFAEILRQRGTKVDRLLQIKHPAPPSLWSLIRALPKYVSPRRRIGWEKLPGKTQPSNSAQPPVAVAWHTFDESTTMQIRRVCRKASVTVNSFLLKHLTKAIRPFLQDQSSVVPWMIPVNLRGKVCRSRDTENHSSYVGVNVRSYETVYDVHRNIYAAMATGEHWANWYSYKSGHLLTSGLRRFLIKHERCMSQWNIGSFSNLGEWDFEPLNMRESCRGRWLFAPPVLRCQLLGAGCVTFQQCLSLTIQAHPELTINCEVPKAWVRNWVKEIEMDLVSVLSEPAGIPIVAA